MGHPVGFADLVMFGLVAGWLTVRTGGLEAAIALHVANNLISSVVAAALGDLGMDETAADMPWQFAVIDVPVLLAYAWVVVRLARGAGVATESSVEPCDRVPPPRGPEAETGLADHREDPQDSSNRHLSPSSSARR
ncbi:CPBP family intramembrane glutamic endopeptidase [Paractinoplanes durhamensis]|uniref:CPBP family intramembrane glutamic endopeptidase n=1 Tax=Paractinoplanes durhamensis TaxID=113563 RepID=UPI00363105F6